MALSKWSISQQGNLTHAGALALKSPIRILVLDDHKLFRNAVTDYCIRPFFKNAAVVELVNGDDAYEYIRDELRARRKINLFITDINHPGLPGHTLVRSIRYLEILYEIPFRMPIIILSMVNETHYPELVAEQLVDSYLTKAAEPEDIIGCIEEILYR